MAHPFENDHQGLLDLPPASCIYDKPLDHQHRRLVTGALNLCHLQLSHNLPKLQSVNP